MVAPKPQLIQRQNHAKYGVEEEYWKFEPNDIFTDKKT